MSSESRQFFSIVRFVTCMMIALAFGVIVNLFIPDPEKPAFRIIDILPLVIYYIPSCLFFGSIMVLWDRLVPGKSLRDLLLVILSVILLVTGFILLPVSEYHGLHFFLICLLGFSLAAIEQFVRARRVRRL